MSNKFNVNRICTEIVSYSQKENKTTVTTLIICVYSFQAIKSPCMWL